MGGLAERSRSRLTAGVLPDERHALKAMRGAAHTALVDSRPPRARTRADAHRSGCLARRRARAIADATDSSPDAPTVHSGRSLTRGRHPRVLESAAPAGLPECL